MTWDYVTANDGAAVVHGRGTWLVDLARPSVVTQVGVDGYAYALGDDHDGVPLVAWMNSPSLVSHCVAGSKRSAPASWAIGVRAVSQGVVWIEQEPDHQMVPCDSAAQRLGEPLQASIAAVNASWLIEQLGPNSPQVVAHRITRG